MTTDVSGGTSRSPPDAGQRPLLVQLDDDLAREASLTGGKAAALARARQAELPTLGGVVLTTEATAAVDRDGGELSPIDGALRELWDRARSEGWQALAVRSSSTVEDTADSSMAGRFESVVGVASFDELREAVTRVLASRQRAAQGDSSVTPFDPMAVLVQPVIPMRAGGVLFSIDPTTGREDRIVVAASSHGAEAVVSGEVQASRYELDRRGALVSSRAGPAGATLGRRRLRRLAALARRVSELFDAPQDVEWAEGVDGELWLLQSRPVTTEPAGVPQGPVLGPGPVSETFPDALSRLEEELWVMPLRRALRQALLLAGIATERDLERSPLVVCVGGRPAVDLQLFGEAGRPTSLWQRLDPRRRVRRLRAAWRVGRLRAALGGLAADLSAQADVELATVPELVRLTDRQLVALLHRAGQGLTALHSHELLIGLLVDPSTPRLTAPSVALRLLAEARADGLDDEEILARYPMVLALTAPRIGAPPTLPRPVEAPAWTRPEECEGDPVLREALRLRIRWLHELSGRAAWELGHRLTEHGTLDTQEDIRHLSLEQVELAVARRRLPPDARRVHPVGPPLPSRFRLSDTGRPIAERDTDTMRGGTGAGGGRGRGPVHHRDGDPPAGAVLVVRTLDPTLAAVLAGLAGLVAETGSVLSHVAILAREADIPTVVGLAGAVEQFPEGTEVEVDGDSGDVWRIEEEATRR